MPPEESGVPVRRSATVAAMPRRARRRTLAPCGLLVISLIARFLRPYRSALIIVVILLTMQVIANLYLPFLNADIINNGVVTGDIGYIVELGAIMLAISLGLGVVSVIAVYFSARTAMAFGRDVRGSLFRSVERFSLRGSTSSARRR